MADGPWLGRVTRVDGAGRPFVVVAALTGQVEYGPLGRLAGAGGYVGGGGATGAPPVAERALAAGDTVLVSAVVGQPSVFVVTGRVV